MKRFLPWLVPGVLMLSLVVLLCYTSATQTEESVLHFAAVSGTTTETAATAATVTTTTHVMDYNLNTASAADLQTVSGIGPALSARILARRSALGGFRSRTELLSVNGIGDALLARIMNDFYIPDEQFPAVTTETAATRKAATAATTTTATVPPLLELNTATAEELLRVPGIDQTLAAEILALRERIGGFQHPYELCLISGTTTDWWATRMQYFYVAGCTDPVVAYTTTT